MGSQSRGSLKEAEAAAEARHQTKIGDVNYRFDFFSRPRTIEELVDEDKVVLYALLVELAKVGSPNVDHPIAKLKHQSCVDVCLCDACQVEVEVSYVEEGGAAEGDDWRSNVRVGDDLRAFFEGCYMRQGD